MRKDVQMMKRMEMNRKTRPFPWVESIVVLSVLTPNIFLPGMPAVRLEQFVVLAGLFTLGYRMLVRKHSILWSERFLLGFLSFHALLLLSLGVGAIRGIRILPNDFFEFYKLVLYSGVFLITQNAVRTQRERDRVLHVFLAAMVISGLVALTQYVDLFGMNRWYVPLIAPTQSRSLLDGYPNPRVIGLTSNPNFYAMMATMAYLTALQFLLRGKVWVYGMLAGFFFLLVLLTKSRTGFVILLVGTMVLYLLVEWRRMQLAATFGGQGGRGRLLLRMGGVFAGIGLLALGFLYLGPEAITWRIRAGLDLFTDASFLTRMRRWRVVLLWVLESPILGWGPAKAVNFGYAIDNEWILLLRSGGVAGTGVLVWTFLQPLRNTKDTFAADLYTSILMVAGVYMMTSVLFHVFQLMPLIMVMAAFSDAAAKPFDSEGRG